MDLCAALGLLALVLFLIAAVGHALWLVFEALFSAIFGSPASRKPRSPDRSRRRLCQSCGTWLALEDDVCPACGFDPADAAARELHELRQVSARIERLVNEGTLDPAAAEEVHRSPEIQRTAIMAKRLSPGVDAAPAPGADLAGLPASAPLWERLDRLLRTCSDIRNLTYGNRKQALAWYRELADMDLERLSD